MAAYFNKTKKFIAVFLLLAIVAPLAAYPQKAQAFLGVGDINFDPSNYVQNTISAINTTISNANESILTGLNGVTASASSWEFWKTSVGDPLAKFALRLIIREMKRMIINYIMTGNFGEPLFVANFQLDARQAAENAARSYLSQLSGINFCGFFPAVIPSVYSLNFNFQFVCSVTSSTYAQFLRDPVSLTEVERLLAQDPSTNFVQTVLTAGQNKAQLIAQAAVANAAAKTGGYIGQTVDTITHQAQANYDAAKKQAGDTAYQEALGRAISTAGTGGSEVTPEQIQQAQEYAARARAEAEAKVPGPQKTNVINTPGQAVKTLLDKAITADADYAIVADEFDQAVVAIVDTLIWKITTDGLRGIFGH